VYSYINKSDFRPRSVPFFVARFAGAFLALRFRACEPGQKMGAVRAQKNRMKYPDNAGMGGMYIKYLNTKGFFLKGIADAPHPLPAHLFHRQTPDQAGVIPRHKNRISGRNLTRYRSLSR
jgi:hypothetical protein